MRIIKRTVLSLLPVAFVFVVPSFALGFEQQQQTDAPQRPAVEDPIRQLNLSPEQREKIRAIREQLREERATINQRLRNASEALEEALDADNPDEAILEQRMRDVAAAQAASMRMRILSEVKIRRILTLEQISTLRHLRQSARDMRRGRQIDNIRREGERQRGLTNQRNSLRPFFPRRVNPNRTPRP